MIKHKEAYNEARSAFDGLKIEEQAIFLVEAAVSMLAHGIEQIGAMMARQFDDEPTGSEENGTAEPAKSTTKTGGAAKTKRTATPRKSRAAKPKSDSST